MNGSVFSKRGLAAAVIAIACCPMGGCGSDTSGSGAGGGSASSNPVPDTFILVHGAWSGAWTWDPVAAGLKENGKAVTTVELPSHGADMTPPNGATLDAYAAKVSAAVDAADGPVTLVGHSMAGVVITEVAEQKPDTIAKLVYLAAFVPEDGQTLLALAGTDADSHLGPALKVDQMAGTAAVPLDELADIFCADCSEDALAALTSHYRDEPLAPFATPVHASAANWGRVAKYYIYTKQDHAISPSLQVTMTKNVTFESQATLDTSHEPFLSQPGLVVSTLLGF